MPEGVSENRPPAIAGRRTVAPTTGIGKRRLPGVARLGGVLLSAAVALVSYRYAAQVGPVPPNIADNRFLDPWIVVHASAAATALLAGPVQFLPTVRQRWPGAHRWTGRIYVVGCLIGGASALVLAAGVSAGPIAGAGFAALGVQWIYATAQGLATARARRFAEHRRWMIRSFALTFAAVTLRVYLPIAVALGFDFIGAYRIIAWLAWVPNAILAEVYLSDMLRPAPAMREHPKGRLERSLPRRG